METKKNPYRWLGTIIIFTLFIAVVTSGWMLMSQAEKLESLYAELVLFRDKSDGVDTDIEYPSKLYISPELTIYNMHKEIIAAELEELKLADLSQEEEVTGANMRWTLVKTILSDMYKEAGFLELPGLIAKADAMPVTNDKDYMQCFIERNTLDEPSWAMSINIIYMNVTLLFVTIAMSILFIGKQAKKNKLLADALSEVDTEEEKPEHIDFRDMK